MMYRRALLLLVIAGSVTNCLGQMEMGAMMEGMAGMGMGGLGMGGLGMGGMGLGGMGMGMGMGMGGMGGLAAMMGGEGGGGGMMGGGIGAMISSIITPMIANTIATSKMSELVKVVIGPHANPNTQMIEYAKLQRRIPANIGEMVPYIEMMRDLAKVTGILMPDGKIKRPAPETTLAVPNANGAGTKNTNGLPTLAEVTKLIVDRGVMWYNSQQQNTAPNSMSPGASGGFVF